MDKSYEKYRWMPDIPEKWSKRMAAYDDKHKWFPVIGKERKESWVSIPCTECNKVFYGSQDGVIELKLHLILQHTKVITDG